MTESGPSTANARSWVDLQAWIDDSRKYDSWENWPDVVSSVLARGSQDGLHLCFRVGQGMLDIIFSTAAHHGLEDQPRVLLVRRGRTSTEVAYWSEATGSVCETVANESLYPALLRQLARLWTTSKPGEKLPNALIREEGMA
ncbi:MAG: hypothetical protein K1Y01_10960 [Vicinamibacteria bacterium]|nr:hypothetical protein [Vicinamibacteria bacterium]